MTQAIPPVLLIFQSDVCCLDPERIIFINTWLQLVPDWGELIYFGMIRLGVSIKK